MPLKYIILLLQLIKMKIKVDVKQRNVLVYSWSGNVRGHWKAIPIITESRMICLYFTISGQGSLAKCLSLTAQTMLLNGLALGPLNFVTLQAIRVLFAVNSLFQWLCPLPWPCLFIYPCCTYIQVHQIPINSRAAQSGTWRACSDATPWSLKTF